MKKVASGIYEYRGFVIRRSGWRWKLLGNGLPSRGLVCSTTKECAFLAQIIEWKIEELGSLGPNEFGDFADSMGGRFDWIINHQ